MKEEESPVSERKIQNISTGSDWNDENSDSEEILRKEEESQVRQSRRMRERKQNQAIFNNDYETDMHSKLQVI